MQLSFLILLALAYLHFDIGWVLTPFLGVALFALPSLFIRPLWVIAPLLLSLLLSFGTCSFSCSPFFYYCFSFLSLCYNIPYVKVHNPSSAARVIGERKRTDHPSPLQRLFGLLSSLKSNIEPERPILNQYSLYAFSMKNFY
jgi:hypothetical protein